MVGRDPCRIIHVFDMTILVADGYDEYDEGRLGPLNIECGVGHIAERGTHDGRSGSTSASGIFKLLCRLGDDVVYESGRWSPAGSDVHAFFSVETEDMATLSAIMSISIHNSKRHTTYAKDTSSKGDHTSMTHNELIDRSLVQCFQWRSAGELACMTRPS